MVSCSGRPSFGVISIVLIASCGGQSRVRGDADESGGRAGESSGGSGGVSGSVARGGQSGAPSGGSASGGSAGTPGQGGTAGMDGGVPPLACDEGEPVELSPEVVAERLAQLFLGAEASEDLIERARADGLGTTGSVGCFARELLDDPSADAGIDDFFDGWLDLGKHPMPAVDPVFVPEFTPALLGRARQASLWYATTIARDGGTLTRLLTDDAVPVDDTLAPLYGLRSDGFGPVLVMVELGEERSGIFTQPYFLMSRTTAAHGSPTQRGLGLAQMLGCADFGVLPVDLATNVPAEFEGTTRAWYENAVADAACAGCHAYLTTAGFALEHYDVLGRHRDEEAGEPIDASGDLAALETGSVTGHAQAMQAAARSPIARECFARHWLAYAVANVRGERSYAVPAVELDARAVEHVVARATHEPDFDLREMFVAGVETAPFLAP